MVASAYKKAGVNISAGDRFVHLIRDRIHDKWPDTSGEIGGFSGRFRFKRRRRHGFAGVDGSGTVAILCSATESFDVLGYKAAQMSLVDLYVGGMMPVALLDILDVAILQPEKHIAIIDGIMSACVDSGPQCRLVGGETAEIPDMLKYDWLVNVNTAAIGEEVPGLVTKKVRPGQDILGWPSFGPGSNGFSLLRKVFGLKVGRSQLLKKLDRFYDHVGRLGDALLQDAPIWIPEVEKDRKKGIVFAAHAHITGGGLVDNIPRVLPPDVKVVLDRSAWEYPAIFRLTQEKGKISQSEMDQVFNQGLMMVSIVQDFHNRKPSSDAFRVGRVEKRRGKEPQVQFVKAFQ